MVAIFEDDARLHPDLPDLPDALDALDGTAEKFDIVKLQRNGAPPYYPVYQLLPSRSLGRVRYYDRGGYTGTSSPGGPLGTCLSDSPPRIGRSTSSSRGSGTTDS